jgi:hypothetical protein
MQPYGSLEPAVVYSKCIFICASGCAGLYGKGLEDAARIDMLVEGFQDVRTKLRVGR